MQNCKAILHVAKPPSLARYCFARKIQMPHQNLKKFTYSILWVMDLIKSIKNSAGEKIMKIKQILCLLFIATALFTTCSNSSSSSSSDDSVSQETTPQQTQPQVAGCASNADCPRGTRCSPVTGQCESIIQGCTDYDENERCIACHGRYSLYNGRCIINVANCIDGDNDGNCIRCLEGYRVSNGECIRNP